MLVCHCHAVSERRIRKAIRNGCASLHELAAGCGAGAGCGGCRPELAVILDEELRAAEPAPVAAAGLTDALATR